MFRPREGASRGAASAASATWLVNDEQEDEQGEEPQEQPRDVLTKPKILPVKIEWARIEEARPGMPQRYVLDAVTYQRLLDAVPK